MKYRILLLIVLLVVGVGVGATYFYTQNQNKTVSVVINEVVTSEEFHLSFAYPSGEAGLSLIEPPVPVDGELKKAYLLFPTESYIAYQATDEPQAVPAGISLFIFTLPETESEIGRITRLQNWAGENNSITSYNAAIATPEVIELDGVRAIRYQTPGVYNQEVYLASYKGNIYMMVGQFTEIGDYLDSTFDTLVQSVTFD